MRRSHDPARLSLSQRSSDAASIAPDWRATSRPPWKTTRVGNAADAVTRRNRAGLLGVELGEPRTRFVACGSLLEYRSHRATRCAPRRPEVDDQRQVCYARHGGGKFAAVSVIGRPSNRGHMALRAAWRVAQALTGHSHKRLSQDLQTIWIGWVIVRIGCNERAADPWGRGTAFPSPPAAEQAAVAATTMAGPPDGSGRFVLYGDT